MVFLFWISVNSNELGYALANQEVMSFNKTKITDSDTKSQMIEHFPTDFVGIEVFLAG